MLDSHRFVIVDDDSQVLEFVELLLKDGFESCEVTKFGKSREALFYITRATPDLVITDFQMPQLNGLELVRHLRVYGFEEPVLLISNHPSIRAEALSAGATAFLDKIDMGDHLAETVKTILRDQTVSV